jgi:hypothetical protein
MGGGGGIIIPDEGKGGGGGGNVEMSGAGKPLTEVANILLGLKAVVCVCFCR